MNIICPFCDGGLRGCQSCEGRGVVIVWGISINGRPVDPSEYPTLLSKHVVVPRRQLPVKVVVL